MRPIPPVVKNLLIINIAVFILSRFLLNDLYYYLSIYFIKSEYFRPYQIITHMFLHADMWHLFFNMFALYMFGMVLEYHAGSKRFFMLYFVAGLGAIFLHEFVVWLQYKSILHDSKVFFNNPVLSNFEIMVHNNKKFFSSDVFTFINEWRKNQGNEYFLQKAIEETESLLNNLNNRVFNIPTMGASGAVFGLLAAFAVLFPNTELYVMFIPIPVKAKYVIPFYAILELFFGVANFKGDNIAHFAHLGGAIFGFIIAIIWKKKQFKIF